MALAVLIITLTLTVYICCIFRGNELMSSVCCVLTLFDVLWFTVMKLENNDVCPVVIPTLKILQVFPLSYFGAELQTHFKSTRKTLFCGKTYTRETSVCEILRLTVSIDEFCCNHLDHIYHSNTKIRAVLHKTPFLGHHKQSSLYFIKANQLQLQINCTST